MILSDYILQEIDRKAVLVETGHHDSGLVRAIQIALYQDSLVHSHELETGKMTKKIKRKIDGEVRRHNGHLEDGWKYATANYHGELTHPLILKTASIIEPVNETESYRNVAVRVSGFDSVMTINPLKIERHLNLLLPHVNDHELHAVERASLLHLHFARIHPLVDGNGRVARLLQNVILRHEGYAPATIMREERSFYQELLRDAMRGYIDRESQSTAEQTWESLKGVSPAEERFYHYIASKVNIGLESLLTAIDDLPCFKVEFNHKVEPGVAYTAKKMLQEYFRQPGRVGQARLVDKRGLIEVRGEINPCIVKGILDKKYKGDYTLSAYNLAEEGV